MNRLKCWLEKTPAYYRVYIGQAEAQKPSDADVILSDSREDQEGTSGGVRFGLYGYADYLNTGLEEVTGLRLALKLALKLGEDWVFLWVDPERYIKKIVGVDFDLSLIPPSPPR